MFYIAAMALGSQLVLAADRVPKFDPAPSCRSAAATSMMTGRTSENCLRDENNARDLLEKSWDQFTAADKSHCDSLQRAGGPASYVELLSCLEMSRDARNMARSNARPLEGFPTGTPAPGTTGADNPIKELPRGTQPAMPKP